MPSVVIQPNSIIGTPAGWNAEGSDIIEAISDGASNTSITQTRTTCNLAVGLTDSEDYAGATITSFRVSILGKAGRAGASTVVVNARDVDGNAYQESELTFSGNTNEQFGAAFEEGLTPALIDEMFLEILPNAQGITIFEVNVTIVFESPPAGYGNAVNGIASTNIVKIIGIATANISKVSGV